MESLKSFSIIFLISLLTACVAYQPKPLNADITQNLSPIDKILLSQQAARLKNPRLPPIQLDFSKPLTPKELAVIAVLVNPDLKALRAKEGVAQAQIFDAGLLPDPQLAASWDHPLHPQPGIVTAYNIAVTWDISSLITRQLKVKSAEQHRQQVRYEIAWQEWMTANQVQLLAERSYFLEQQLHLLQQASAESKQLLDITQYNLQKHDIKIDEFGLRQSAYLDLHDQFQTLERTLTKTRLQLNQTLGLAPTENIAIQIKSVPIPSNLDAEALFARARDNRLDIMALQAGYASQESQLYQAVLGQFPRFNLGISRARDNTNVNSLGGIISFDIPIFNGNRGTIAIAKATREQLYLEYTGRLHQTRADIATLVADLRHIRNEESKLRKALPALQTAQRLMRQGLKSGNITLVSYQDVYLGLINKQLKLLMLKQDAAEQMTALQLASGSYWQADGF